MNLFTRVEICKLSPAINYSDSFLMMGSCFITEIGERLTDAKFRCRVNPFGVLYNPMSVAHSLRVLLNNASREISSSLTWDKIIPHEGDIFFHQGLWHSFAFHGDFSASTKEQLLRNIGMSMDACQDIMNNVTWCFLTFGTAYVYEWKETGKIVANCHKLPENLFTRRRLAVDEIVDEYRRLLADMWQVNPQLKVMLTVSPIRHIRDGLHENQLSKSVLHLAIDILQQSFPDRVFYFPAYELLTDELRDYRYYADDLVHPSRMAVEYVWQRFVETCIDKEAVNAIESVKEIKKMLDHRPLHPESPEYARFLHQIVLKIETLSKKYPYFEFEKEKEICLTRLNRLH
ncbi:MAG: GSCFA domain-containing protein [Bacteroidaceae bacterium]|nr:GSCFA domain-containing protein [Bacteroidaceae bacterium]